MGERLREHRREARDQPTLVPAVVEQDALGAVTRGELAPLGRVGQRDLQADLLRDHRAPSSDTRPCTRVPSMVKNRRPGEAIGEE